MAFPFSFAQALRHESKDPFASLSCFLLGQSLFTEKQKRMVPWLCVCACVCKNLPVRSVMVLRAHVAPRVQLGAWVHVRRVRAVAQAAVCTGVAVAVAVVAEGTVRREEDAGLLAWHDPVRERIVVTVMVVPELADITFEANAELNPS